MEKVIRTAPREVLLSIEFIWALAAAVTALDLSRRATLDWLAETIFGWLERDGIILDADGSEIAIDDELIDRAHGNDPSCVWISELKAAQRPQRRSKSTMLSRLRLYDAAFRIIDRPLT